MYKKFLFFVWILVLSGAIFVCQASANEDYKVDIAEKTDYELLNSLGIVEEVDLTKTALRLDYLKMMEKLVVFPITTLDFREDYKDDQFIDLNIESEEAKTVYALKAFGMFYGKKNAGNELVAAIYDELTHRECIILALRYFSYAYANEYTDEELVKKAEKIGLIYPGFNIEKLDTSVKCGELMSFIVRFMHAPRTVNAYGGMYVTYAIDEYILGMGILQRK